MRESVGNFPVWDFRVPMSSTYFHTKSTMSNSHSKEHQKRSTCQQTPLHVSHSNLNQQKWQFRTCLHPVETRLSASYQNQVWSDFERMRSSPIVWMQLNWASWRVLTHPGNGKSWAVDLKGCMSCSAFNITSQHLKQKLFRGMHIIQCMGVCELSAPPKRLCVLRNTKVHWSKNSQPHTECQSEEFKKGR